jgi:hypothetical protein
LRYPDWQKQAQVFWFALAMPLQAWAAWLRRVHDCAHAGSPWASSWAEAREAERRARRAVVSMAVENMAAAKGVSSAVAAEGLGEDHGEDSRVDVYGKSEVLLVCYGELVADQSEECSGNLPPPESLFPCLGHALNEGEEGTGMRRAIMSVRFEIL